MPDKLIIIICHIKKKSKFRNYLLYDTKEEERKKKLWGHLISTSWFWPKDMFVGTPINKGVEQFLIAACNSLR